MKRNNTPIDVNVIAYRSPLLKLPHFRSEQLRAKRSSFVSMGNPSRTGSPNGLQTGTSGTEFPYAQADKGNHGAKIQEKDGKAKGFRRIILAFSCFFSAVRMQLCLLGTESALLSKLQYNISSAITLRPLRLGVRIKTSLAVLNPTVLFVSLTIR